MADLPAEGTIEELIQSFDPGIKDIVRALKRRITAIHAGYLEITWPRLKIASYGIGPKKMSEHYAYIAPFKSHVNLGFYHGVALNDPAGLLEGAGKRLRHIKITSLEDVDKPEIGLLLEAAVHERQSAS